MEIAAVVAGGMPVAAGTVGALLSLVGTGLYLRDIRRGTTRPHRGSWTAWAVIAVVAAASVGWQTPDGWEAPTGQQAWGGWAAGHWSQLVLIAQALGTVTVFAWSLRRGLGRLTPVNLFMLAVAGLGVVGWLTLTDPTAASACAALADGSGLLAMMPKTWADPFSETASTYALAGVTGLLSAVAVPVWHLSLLLFPVYFCAGNTLTASVILLRRRTLRCHMRRAPGIPPVTNLLRPAAAASAETACASGRR